MPDIQEERLARLQAETFALSLMVADLLRHAFPTVQERQASRDRCCAAVEGLYGPGLNPEGGHEVVQQILHHLEEAYRGAGVGRTRPTGE